MIEWEETEVKWTYDYMLKVRTDGTRWQIQASNYIPTPSGRLEEYIDELRKACAKLDDPILDCWIQGVEMGEELSAEVRGWRNASEQESERIERNLKKRS